MTNILVCHSYKSYRFERENVAFEILSISLFSSYLNQNCHDRAQTLHTHSSKAHTHNDFCFVPGRSVWPEKTVVKMSISAYGRITATFKPSIAAVSGLFLTLCHTCSYKTTPNTRRSSFWIARKLSAKNMHSTAQPFRSYLWWMTSDWFEILYNTAHITSKYFYAPDRFFKIDFAY